MRAAALPGGVSFRRELAEWLAWRPEWPAALAAVAAWVALIALNGSHAAMATMDGATSGALATAVAGVFGVPLAGWALMSVAMMTVVTLPAVRHVTLNSLRGRRARGTAVYLTTYFGVWVAFGAVALSVIAVARAAGADQKVLVVVTFATATAWQLSRWKRRAVVACPRTVPIPPAGWRADRACGLFGLRQGGRCVVSCAPLMVLMAVIGHPNLIVMVGLTGLIAAEKLSRNRLRLVRPVAAMLAAATIWTAILA